MVTVCITQYLNDAGCGCPEGSRYTLHIGREGLGRDSRRKGGREGEREGVSVRACVRV